MSKFDLRDISDKLTGSKDTEGVVDTLLAYLRAVQPDWHPTLAFYEVSRDALVRVYDRETGRLLREAENLALNAGGCAGRLAGIYGPGRSFLLKNLLEGKAAIVAEERARGHVGGANERWSPTSARRVRS